MPPILFTALFRRAAHRTESVRELLLGITSSSSSRVVFQTISEAALDSIFASAAASDMRYVAAASPGTRGPYVYDPTILYTVTPEQEEEIRPQGEYLGSYLPKGLYFTYEIRRERAEISLQGRFVRAYLQESENWYRLTYPEVLYPSLPTRPLLPMHWELYRMAHPQAVEELRTWRESRVLSHARLIQRNIEDVVHEAHETEQAHELKALKAAQSRGGLRRVLFIGEDL